MYDVIAAVLAFFYDLWPTAGKNGMSIVMLTLAVMLVVSPLTFKSTKSMIAMQRLQPELKQLRAEYGDDRQVLNEQMMALYQREGVNPVGGCFPMLVQLPVFLVLYGVIRGITRRTDQLGLSLGSKLGFESAFGGAPTSATPATEFAERTFNPAYLDVDSDMYQALNGETEMNSFGFDLGRSAQSVLADSIGSALPYLALIIVVGLTAWVQQRQVAGRNPNAVRNPQQEMIMKVLPFFLPIISFGLPAAVVLYFVVSNLFRLGQQTIITQRYYRGENAPAPIDTTAKEVPAKPTPAVAKSTATAVRERPQKAAPSSGGRHGSRRPTSRQPKSKPKQKRNEPQRAAGPKPTKPPKSKKKGGRVTPKGGSSSDPDVR